MPSIKKASTLHSRWTPKDERLLRRLAGKKSAEDLAKELRRSVMAVQTHASSLGISLAVRSLPRGSRDKKGRKGPQRLLKVPWSEDDERRFREMAGNLLPKSIAKALGRTPRAVERKAAKMNLSLAVIKRGGAPNGADGASVDGANGSGSPRDQIALRAYYISERRAAANQKADPAADWIEAEREVAEAAGRS